MRPSMSRPRIASPAYSTAQPTPPAVPILPISARIRSLAVTPRGGLPSKRARMVFGFCCTMVWVASTCVSSLVPIPQASAPSAPWVQVWLSPQSSVTPGSVKPSSGPTTCTMPWPSWPMS